MKPTISFQQNIVCKNCYQDESAPNTNTLCASSEIVEKRPAHPTRFVSLNAHKPEELRRKAKLQQKIISMQNTFSQMSRTRRKRNVWNLTKVEPLVSKQQRPITLQNSINKDSPKFVNNLNEQSSEALRMIEKTRNIYLARSSPLRSS